VLARGVLPGSVFRYHGNPRYPWGKKDLERAKQNCTNYLDNFSSNHKNMSDFFAVPSTEWVNAKLGIMMIPEVPYALVALYLLSKPLFEKIRDHFGIEGKGPILNLVVVIHNLLLAIFSGWTFYHAIPLFNDYILSDKQSAMSQEDVWNNTHMGALCIVFYVSKYYEFADSWILVLKGYDPEFLQVYHHAGVVWSMYFACKHHACYLIWLVTLNSFIHTIMYIYFACRAHFGAEGNPLGFFKPFMTGMQISQFLIGIVGCVMDYFKESVNDDQKRSIALMQIYVVGLIYLFSQMFKKNYVDKPKDDSAAPVTRSSKKGGKGN
jgi:hypothetical protein